MNYRKLTPTEIIKLDKNGCIAEDWDWIEVKDPFNPAQIKRVTFCGHVRIGFDCKMFVATISNCTIGNNTEIRSVELIDNYSIGANCYISHSKRIVADKSASMGNGTIVDVLDETGGRNVKICQKLSAQVAYMMTFYRHDTALINSLSGLVDEWTARQKSPMGRISDGVSISYATSIENVNFGLNAKVRGASKLQNGSVGVAAQIMENVCATDFIACDQSIIGTGCIVAHVFLGQAAKLGSGLVAHNSLIFSNCAFDCGELDALFAGPHACSLHRATLLIAAYISFFNAGSGSNQSNHNYCTGPIHHGILERGSKTGSNSYIKWPARFAQYSVVVGSHMKHPDASALPFSYIIGKSGDTTVIPAANLKTCGLMRDVLKWPDRDARDEYLERLDNINYDEFTPANISRIFAGLNLLTDLQKDPHVADSLRINVSPSHIEDGIKTYRLALKYYFGRALVLRLSSKQPLSTACTADVSSWVDMSGMIAPKSVVDALCERVKASEFATIEQLNAEISRIHNGYKDYSWKYVLENFSKVYGLDLSSGSQDLTYIIKEWISCAEQLCEFRKTDALKDFSEVMSVEFGMDHPEMAAADSAAVRHLGSDERHIKAIRTITDFYEKEISLAKKLIIRLICK